MPKLVVRVDATASTGMGHLMRCLALVQGWREHGGVSTVIGMLEGDGVHDRVTSAGATFVPVEAHTQDADLSKAVALVRDVAPATEESWIVLDGYDFAPGYQLALREAGYRLLVIDDVAHLPHYHASLLVNQNIGAEQLVYQTDVDTGMLLGTDYAMLWPEFRGQPPVREFSSEARRILVTLGGTDPNDVTSKVLRALGAAGIDGLHVRVVAGPTNPNLASLQSVVDEARDGSFELLHGTGNMRSCMTWADLAISGGGTTTWELSRLGVPSILLVVAENQRLIAEGVSDAGAAVAIGSWDESTGARLVAEVQRLAASAEARKAMSRRAQALVDGHGVDRIVDAMLLSARVAGTRSAGKPSLRLRLATKDDATLLLDWRNDPATRAASVRRSPVSVLEHTRWITKTLADPSRRLFIAEQEGVPVGMVRADQQGDGHELSWSVAPGARGKGVGTEMVRQATESTGGRVTAKIRAANLVSARIAQRVGMRRVRATGGFVYFAREVSPSSGGIPE